jgi:hypothetical protein
MICFNLDLNQNIRLKIMYLPTSPRLLVRLSIVRFEKGPYG